MRQPPIRIPRAEVADAALRAANRLCRKGGEVEDALKALHLRVLAKRKEALRQLAAEAFSEILHELRIDWRA